MFVYLSDVPDELGPPHLVPLRHTADVPVRPNWRPRAGGADPEGGFVATAGSPQLYEAEESAAGPAGPGQLALFGFPPSGHPFWTPEAASAMALRYPGTDWSAWI